MLPANDVPMECVYNIKYNLVLGINRKVRYATTETDGQFAIDTVSGIITLRRQLDREHQSMYNITLYAHDQVSCH